MEIDTIEKEYRILLGKHQHPPDLFERFTFELLLAIAKEIRAVRKKFEGGGE